MDIANSPDGAKAILTLSGEEFATLELSLDAYLKATEPLVKYTPKLELTRSHARIMMKQMDDAMKEAEDNGGAE